MICGRCRLAFFSPGTRDSLQSGQRFEILSWALEVPENNSCTICSTVLKDIFAALSSHSQRLGDVPDREKKRDWKQEVESWPSLPVKVEKRVGRFSFIVGPSSADYILKNGTTWSNISMKARLFIMSSQTHETDTVKALGGSTDSEKSVEQARKWLEACNDPHKHKECSTMAQSQAQRRQPSGEAPFVPTRLLDVGTLENPVIRLVGNTHDEGVRGPYTTLSHMWGIPMGDRFQLTSDNYKQFCTRIDEADPKMTLTFRQGMQITRRLGVRYVWIDSICINQSDSSDFVRESATMEEIYRNSYCNIAAVDSENGSQGLFRARRAEDLPPDIVEYGSQKYSILRPDFWDQQVLSGPLYARGWVLQERMLTPRILHFAKDQIFWQCPSLTACESSPSSLPVGVHGEDAKLELKWRRALHQDRLVDLEMADLNAIWRYIVHSYTRCNLTFSGDKPIALSGVAKAMQRGLEERFLAGLWDSVLPENRELADLGDQLCWTAESGKKIDGTDSTRYKEYRAPSWSWASLDGIITLRDRIIERNPIQTFKISDAVVTLRDTIWPTGPVRPEGTGLKLCVMTLSMRFYHAVADNWNRWESQHVSADSNFTCDGWLDDVEDVARMRNEEGSIVADVAILSCDVDLNSAFDGLHAGHGLILRHSGGSAGTFLRVGCVTFSGLTKTQWQVLTGTSAWEDMILV